MLISNVASPTDRGWSDSRLPLPYFAQKESPGTYHVYDQRASVVESNLTRRWSPLGNYKVLAATACLRRLPQAEYEDFKTRFELALFLKDIEIQLSRPSTVSTPDVQATLKEADQLVERYSEIRFAATSMRFTDSLKSGKLRIQPITSQSASNPFE